MNHVTKKLTLLRLTLLRPTLLRLALLRLALLRLALLTASLFVAALPSLCLAEDLVEFLSGAKVTGTVKQIRKDKREFDFEAKVGNQTLTRTYQFNKVHAVTMNGKRYVLTAKPSGGRDPSGSDQGTVAAPVKRVERTRAEVLALIESVGRTPPDWFKSTPLRYPQSLALSWPNVPKPLEKNWNSRKHIGHYVWDVINPNRAKWREGIRFLHHVVGANKNNRGAQVKAMNQLGALYASLMQDWSRAAFWWRQAGRGTSGGMGQGGFRSGYNVGLAKCYWELGNKQMAIEQLNKANGFDRSYSGALLLWAEMGEHDKALEIGEQAAKKHTDRYMICGDVCRHAGRYDEAMAFYRKAANVGAQKKSARLQQIASERIAGLTAEKTLDLARTRDGTYTSSSLAYTGMITVSVTVDDHRITSVKVTRHTEKQYYSSLTDIPSQIIQKQGVKGIDATTSATITSEAIVAASAKALMKGAR